ncbi:MAG TPA: flagellar basal body rod protein FlgB [Burkholderiaceae bacterium]|nr:flagellar basal body rod protein FlgB [Burkholderiaceae bacterium]
MLDKITQTLDFDSTALLLQSERTRVLASNIANADTPNYKARDFDFRTALEQATQQATAAGAPAATLAVTQPGHIAAGGAAGPTHPALLYRTPLQTALDANSVDLDTERAAFAENAVRYEASLRFINGQIKTLMTAINGQS